MASRKTIAYYPDAGVRPRRRRVYVSPDGSCVAAAAGGISMRRAPATISR
ncbi:MAG TPA: hypothetical protein VNE82_04725 [Candidatus Binataceae bacterium]|nr:hypothetical protein [Candidatus Binataceae bacterium]